VIDATMIERIREVLSPLRPVAVYVFGSNARGRPRTGSDLDLAILPAAPIAGLRLFETASRLAAVAGRNVDLVDLSSASTVLGKEVLAGGRLLYETNARRRAEFEMRVLVDYARLNEERAPVLEALGQPLDRDA
jgi:predicted nucleotidyltransferase